MASVRDPHRTCLHLADPEPRLRCRSTIRSLRDHHTNTPPPPAFILVRLIFLLDLFIFILIVFP